MRRVGNRDRRVQQLEDSLGTGHGRLQNVVFVTQILNRPEEPLRILNEGNGRPEGDGALERHAPAAVKDDGDRHHAQQLHGGVEEAVGQDGILVGVPVGLVDPVELLQAAVLVIEELNHGHPRQVLLQVRVDARDGEADAPVGFPHRLAEPHRGQHDERQDGKRQQRQLRVHPKHHDHDAHEREEVPEDGDHAGGEQVVQHVHVRGHAGNHPPHGVAIEEAQLQALQVRKDLFAQIVHHALADHLHGEVLSEFQQERQQRRRQIEQDGNLNNTHEGTRTQKVGEEARDFLVSRGIQVVVHRQLEQVGRNRLHDAIKDAGHERQHHDAGVRPQVAHQAPHQAPVVSLAENFFFVDTVCHGN